jgi:DNA ligase D-like protein (predicted ligase)
LAEALANASKFDFVADGEVVAMKDGLTSFATLQPRMHSSKPNFNIPVKLYLFDLMHLGGFNLTKLPLRTRKTLLKKALDFEDPLRYTPHRNENGTAYLKEACQKKWEGLIAKDAGSTYVHSRSKKWLKFKCQNRQEFVIGGFTEPQGGRSGFGALLVGVYQDGELQYAGKVGTGYDDAFLNRFRAVLDDLETPRCPFANFSQNGDQIHWVEPKEVGEVSFTEWTSNGKLRHPSFLGLREDKDPKKVVKEG